MAPERGINALNAVIHLFTGIDALRQHVRSDVRSHGVITDGGKAPNVVPDFAAANFMLRSSDRHYLDDVVELVARVAQGVALLTGATLEIKPYYPSDENTRPNQVLSRRAREHAQAVGIPLASPNERRAGASTDFGNVSQRIPSFALSFAVSESPVAGHSLAMTEAAQTELAQNAHCRPPRPLPCSLSTLSTTPPCCPPCAPTSRRAQHKRQLRAQHGIRAAQPRLLQ